MCEAFYFLSGVLFLLLFFPVCFVKVFDEMTQILTVKHDILERSGLFSLSLATVTVIVGVGSCPLFSMPPSFSSPST